MSMTQAEFRRRVEQHMAGDLGDNEGVRCNIKEIYEIVRSDPATAREFVEFHLASQSGNLLLLTAVTGAYQMATGDGSLWPRLENRAQEISYIMYEMVEIFTAYHQADLWDQLPERKAAVEYWLVSGRENARCDFCEVPLPQGSGFLVQRGPVDFGGHIGAIIQIVHGAELFCDRCFDGPEFRKHRLLRKPRRLEEWDQYRGPQQFAQHDPPDVTQIFLECSAAEPSLDALHKWIDDYRRPDAPQGSFQLRLQGRQAEFSSPKFEQWTKWERRLEQEADRAEQIRETDPEYALALGRTALRLSTIITSPLFKLNTLSSLMVFFRNINRPLELSDVLGQLVAAARSLLDLKAGPALAKKQEFLLLFLTELTACLSRSERHDEALARAFEWLAVANNTSGREAAREPRRWVAESLFAFGKYALTKEALENNGVGLFMWMEMEADIGETDDKTWEQGVLYARTLRAGGELAQAIQILSRLVQKIPQSVERFEVGLALSELGFALGDVGHREEAAENLRKAALVADEIGMEHLADRWRTASRAYANPADLDIYAVAKADDDFFNRARDIEEEARKTNNLLDLANALANLALSAPPDEDERYFEKYLQTAEKFGKNTGTTRLYAMFSARLFATGRLRECRSVLDRAQVLLDGLLSTNIDSASRQELVSTLSDLLDVRTELASHEGNWPDVTAFGEQFRARNLSRWMRIARLGEGSQSDTGADESLSLAIQRHRAAEVEAEVRHLLGETDGESLRELDRRRRSGAAYIQHRRGLPAADLDKHFIAWSHVHDKLASLLEPDVGVLSFVSCRRRTVWTLASKDHATNSLMLGGARHTDEVDASSGVPLFRNLPYERRAFVSETIQKQLGGARSDRHLRLDPIVGADLPNALPVWESELELIAQAVERRGVKRLFVVPHRELARLPFWGLVDICELDAISIVPSAEVAAACLSRSRSMEGDSLLIPDRTSTLAFARRELAEVLSLRADHGTARMVDDYPSLTEESRTASVIHVAAHGYFNSDNPYDSGFGIGPADGARQYFDRFTPLHEFCPSREPGSGDMRLLTVATVMSELRLDACRLVVLSACESGVPRIHSGGELTGLPNAFLLAGAKSVIASLWRVDDRATYLLMRYFYEEWCGGRGTEPSPAVALAKARQRLKRTDRVAAQTVLGSNDLSHLVGEYPFEHPRFVDAFHCYGAW
ncbi:CHAT domain-containing protein [Mesorhizobium sp. M0047]|uniref:CHAT domain-containing protein n=1 Tax=Mesorhizobium sp. M0047 TaxID=2956859 RepID=UPI00333500AB